MNSKSVNWQDFPAPGIFNFHQWPIHLETIVEIILKYEQAKISTNVALWSSEVQFKDLYSWKFISTRNSIYKYSPEGLVRNYLVNNKSETVKLLPFIKQNNICSNMSNENRLSIKDISDLKYDNHEVGKAILSSIGMNLQSLRKDYALDKRKILIILNSFASVYRQTLDIISNKRLESVIVFNGRFIHDFAVVCAAKKSGTNLLYYEKGGNLKDYILSEYSVHNRKEIQNEMKIMMDSSEPYKVYELSKEWFDLQGTNYRFKNNSNKIKNFSNFPGLKISYFSSSEDELFSLDSNWKETVGSQGEVLNYLNDYAKRHPNEVRILVRDHPNFRRRKRKAKKEWVKMMRSFRFLEYVHYRSKINSYLIIKNSDIVITHGSTIGVEAANMGKKVISTYPSFYDELGIAFLPKSFGEIETFLKTRKKLEQNPQHHLYGHFMMVRGFEFNKILEADNRYIYLKLSRSTIISKCLNFIFNMVPQKLVKY